MDSKGQMNIAAVAISTLVFLVVLVVYGQWGASMANTVIFNGGISTGVTNLVNLIPLVLVGAAIIGIVVAAFNMSQ